MSAGFDRIRCVGLIAALAAGRAQAEWVVGGYLGASHTVDSALGISQPDGKQSLPGVGWESRSLGAPPYYGLQVAYFFAEGGPSACALISATTRSTPTTCDRSCNDSASHTV